MAMMVRAEGASTVSSLDANLVIIEVSGQRFEFRPTRGGDYAQGLVVRTNPGLMGIYPRSGNQVILVEEDDS